MSQKEQSNDNTRRTFLRLLGVMGTATAGVGTVSSSAVAETTTTDAMKTLDLNPDNIVPTNKYLSFSVTDLAAEQVETLDVLVDGTPVSNMQMYSVNENSVGGLLNTFELVTNHGLQPGESLPIEAMGTTTSGESFVASGITDVVDPASILGDEQSGSSGLTGTVDETVSEVTGTVDSTGILGSPSTNQRQQQMY